MWRLSKTVTAAVLLKAGRRSPRVHCMDGERPFQPDQAPVCNIVLTTVQVHRQLRSVDWHFTS
jgi:hypothetical protein